MPGRGFNKVVVSSVLVSLFVSCWGFPSWVHLKLYQEQLGVATTWFGECAEALESVYGFMHWGIVWSVNGVYAVRNGLRGCVRCTLWGRVGECELGLRCGEGFESVNGVYAVRKGWSVNWVYTVGKGLRVCMGFILWERVG